MMHLMKSVNVRCAFLKKSLNLMPAPSNEVRTTSPLAIMVLPVSGKSNFIAISCPAKRRWRVSIKTPLELILLIGAWKLCSMVRQEATTRWTPFTFLRASFLLSKFWVWPLGIKLLYMIVDVPAWLKLLVSY